MSFKVAFLYLLFLYDIVWFYNNQAKTTNCLSLSNSNCKLNQVSLVPFLLVGGEGGTIPEEMPF